MCKVQKTRLRTPTFDRLTNQSPKKPEVRKWGSLTRCAARGQLARSVATLVIGLQVWLAPCDRILIALEVGRTEIRPFEVFPDPKVAWKSPPTGTLSPNVKIEETYATVRLMWR